MGKGNDAFRNLKRQISSSFARKIIPSRFGYFSNDFVAFFVAQFGVAVENGDDKMLTVGQGHDADVVGGRRNAFLVCSRKP